MIVGTPQKFAIDFIITDVVNNAQWVYGYFFVWVNGRRFGNASDSSVAINACYGGITAALESEKRYDIPASTPLFACVKDAPDLFYQSWKNNKLFDIDVSYIGQESFNDTTTLLAFNIDNAFRRIIVQQERFPAFDVTVEISYFTFVLKSFLIEYEKYLNEFLYYTDLSRSEKELAIIDQNLESDSEETVRRSLYIEKHRNNTAVIKTVLDLYKKFDSTVLIRDILQTLDSWIEPELLYSLCWKYCHRQDWDVYSDVQLAALISLVPYIRENLDIEVLKTVYSILEKSDSSILTRTCYTVLSYTKGIEFNPDKFPCDNEYSNKELVMNNCVIKQIRRIIEQTA